MLTQLSRNIGWVTLKRAWPIWQASTTPKAELSDSVEVARKSTSVCQYQRDVVIMSQPGRNGSRIAIDVRSLDPSILTCAE